MSRVVSGLGLTSPIQVHLKAVPDSFEKARLLLPWRAKLLFTLLVFAAAVACFAGASAFGEPPTARASEPLLAFLIVAGSLEFARSGSIQREDGRELQAATSVSPIVPAPSSSWREQEDERKYLSRELHDSVGPILTGVGLQLTALRSAQLPLEELQSGLDEVQQLNAEALRLVRDLAMGLRPSVIDDVGLVVALEWQARQFSRQTEIPTSVESDGKLDELSEAHRICIYRCVQEALTNCAKHAHAKSIRIVICASGDGVNVTIEDDGIGMDRNTRSDGGLGLLGMRERVAELNGELRVASRECGGTAIILEIPLSGSVLV